MESNYVIFPGLRVTLRPDSSAEHFLNNFETPCSLDDLRAEARVCGAGHGGRDPDAGVLPEGAAERLLAEGVGPSTLLHPGE